MKGRKKTNKEFVKEIYELAGNEYTFLDEYQNSITKIKCKHNKCGRIYLVSPNHFLRGIRCSDCAIKKRADKKRKTDKEFTEQIYELVKDEYIFLEEYQGARTKIKVKHNNNSCSNHEYDTTPDNFLGGRRCPRCSGLEKKSNEKFIAEIYNLVGDEYRFLEEYETGIDKIKCVHSVCDYKWKIRPNNFLTGARCPKCFGTPKKTDTEFKKEIYGLVKDEYIFFEKYKGSHDKILVRHNNEMCNNFEYKVTPTDFLGGRRCPKCAGKMLKTKEEFIMEVYSLTRNEYTVLGDYTNAKTKILLRHNSDNCDNHYYQVKPTDFIKGTRCPKCKSSKGEKYIYDMLNNFGVIFTPQYRFEDCRYIKPLPFDFIILNKGEVVGLIEFDGEQHFKPVKFNSEKDETAEKAFELQKIKDQIKNNYCLNNNIPLLRIPYWESENIEHILFDFLVEHGALEEITV